jgi:hypothetical protein
MPVEGNRLTAGVAESFVVPVEMCLIRALLQGSETHKLLLLLIP